MKSFIFNNYKLKILFFLALIWTINLLIFDTKYEFIQVVFFLYGVFLSWYETLKIIVSNISAKNKITNSGDSLLN